MSETSVRTDIVRYLTAAIMARDDATARRAADAEDPRCQPARSKNRIDPRPEPCLFGTPGPNPHYFSVERSVPAPKEAFGAIRAAVSSAGSGLQEPLRPVPPAHRRARSRRLTAPDYRQGGLASPSGPPATTAAAARFASLPRTTGGPHL